MTSTKVHHLHPQACALQRGDKYDLWVQSPNGQWILLSGQWMKQSAAQRFAVESGYVITERNIHVLNEIEAQLNKRFGADEDGPMVTSH